MSSRRNPGEGGEAVQDFPGTCEPKPKAPNLKSSSYEAAPMGTVRGNYGNGGLVVPALMHGKCCDAVIFQGVSTQEQIPGRLYPHAPEGLRGKRFP